MEPDIQYNTQTDQMNQYEAEYRESRNAPNFTRKRRQKMESVMKECLIAEVQKHREIWNRDFQQTKNGRKPHIWSQITKNVNSNFGTNYPAAVFNDTWGNLRDTLKKFRRKLRNYDESSGEPEPSWIYYESLWFLNQEMERRELNGDGKGTNGRSGNPSGTSPHVSNPEHSMNASDSEPTSSQRIVTEQEYKPFISPTVLVEMTSVKTEPEDEVYRSHLLMEPDIQYNTQTDQAARSPPPHNHRPPPVPHLSNNPPTPPQRPRSPPMKKQRILDSECQTAAKHVTPLPMTPFSTCLLCNTQGASDNMRSLDVWADKTSTLAIRLCFSDILEEMRLNSGQSSSEMIHICETHLCDVHEPELSMSDGNDTMILQWNCMICGQQKPTTHLKKIYKRGAARKVEKALEIGIRLSSNKEWPLRICRKHIETVLLL